MVLFLSEYDFLPLFSLFLFLMNLQDLFDHFALEFPIIFYPLLNPPKLLLKFQQQIHKPHHFLLKGANGKGVSGKEASDRLEKENIIVNMNTIPQDPRGVMDPSGIRLGTAAETTRGKKEKDMREIAKRIDEILKK